jgi:HD superfamily phosphohydrolase YqeK
MTTEKQYSCDTCVFMSRARETWADCLLHRPVTRKEYVSEYEIEDGQIVDPCEVHTTRDEWISENVRRIVIVTMEQAGYRNIYEEVVYYL